MADGSDAQPEYHALKTGKSAIDAFRDLERNSVFTAQERGVRNLWWLIYCAVLGIDPHTGKTNSNAELSFAGKNDEYAIFRVQLARRFIKQREMLAKDQRLAFEGVATNNDARSWAEVNIGTKAMEYVLTEGKLETEASGALNSLCNFGASALHTDWDYQAGQIVTSQEPETDEQGELVTLDVYDPQSGAPVMETDEEGYELLDEEGYPQIKQEPSMIDVQKPSGMPRTRKLYPWQWAVDPYLEDDHPWVIVKIPVNKYELAAQYGKDDPAKTAAILASTIDDEMGDDALFAWGGKRFNNSDTVVLRIYYHRNCAAVPGGRTAGYLKDVGLWGIDDLAPCPLKEGIPVKFMIASKYFGTAFGYPESGDLLALQTVVNEIVSMGLSSIQKRGNPNAYKPDTMMIDKTAFSEGGNLYDCMPGQIQGGKSPVVWDDPPEVGGLAQFLLEFSLEQIKGILGSNSVVEGNPDANITSGAFAVMLVNVAQKFNSDYEEAYDRASTGAANDSLELMKSNAPDGFWVEVGGIGNKPYYKLMATDTLKSMRRLKVVRKHPVLSTYPGRRDLFDATVTLPEEQRAAAATMLLTGDLEPWASDDQADAIRIEKENEDLLDPMMPMPQVQFTDHHSKDVKRHRMEWNRHRSQDVPPEGTPERAEYDEVNFRFEEHCRMHAMALATTPPPLALVSGWEPLMMGKPVDNGGNPIPPEQGEGNSAGQTIGAAADSTKPAAGGGSKGQGKQPEAPKPPKPPKPPQGAAGTVAANP